MNRETEINFIMRCDEQPSDGGTAALESDERAVFGILRTSVRQVLKQVSVSVNWKGARRLRMRIGFLLLTILAALLTVTYNGFSQPFAFFKTVDFFSHSQQNLASCSCKSYNVSLVNRSSGGDVNCLGIPSVLCGNVSCESVVHLIKPAVLCEAHNFMDTDQQRNCTAKKLVYTCAQLNESTLPCAKDYVVEELDYHLQFHCLLKIAQSLPSTHKVPPIHHQVWFYEKERDLEFHEYIALLSHLRFLEAHVLFIWNNGFMPRNKWWQELLAQHNQPLAPQNHITQITSGNVTRKVQLLSTKIYVVRRKPPLQIYNMPIEKVQHQSDVTRLEAMLLFGGFYADVDTLSLRSHKPLLQHSITMSMEGPESLTNMAIFAEPRSPHLFLWHYSYASFDKGAWSEWSIQRNFRIARRCPHFMHTEPNGLARPDWFTRHLLASGEQNISESHTMHLYWRYIDHGNLTSPQGLLQGKFMAHRIFRGIYYGLCDVCG